MTIIERKELRCVETRFTVPIDSDGNPQGELAPELPIGFQRRLSTIGKPIDGVIEVVVIDVEKIYSLE